jgi:Phosphoesterase family
MQTLRIVAGRLIALGAATATLVALAVAAPTTSPAVAAAPPVARPDHVVMVMMENHSYDQILNNYGVTHPSLPDYYALLSASNIVTTNTWPAPSSVDTDNLPNELVTHGLTFADYADQGLPTQWLRYTTTPGTADQLNPMDKRLADFPFTTAGYAALPTVSFVVGNGNQSMHDGTIAQGDAWVKSTLGGYVDWARTHNSLLILTWDEDDFTPVDHVATILYGPMARAGSYGQKVNHARSRSVATRSWSRGLLRG